jgi:hypothetical protein
VAGILASGVGTAFADPVASPPAATSTNAAIPAPALRERPLGQPMGGSHTDTAIGPTGGFGSAIVWCSNLYHTIEVDGSVTASPGTWYYPGQYVGFRVWIYSYKLNRWSAGTWMMGYAWPTFALNQTSASLTPGQYAIYMDYAWWTGTGYVYAHESVVVYNAGLKSCFV